jgi:Tol biopolymer transport system component
MRSLPAALLGTLACLVVGALLPAGAIAQAVSDPALDWHTLETPRFAVHYHEPLEPLARRVVVVAERAFERLGPLLRYVPDAQTHFVLTDDTDFANGSASALPFNTIRLFATAPEDLSPLSDYDDWLTELIFHESTHILHLDQVRGIPALVNAILGKTWVPNAVAPRWFLEGLAVYLETELTSAGRLRSSVWDMYLRMDALEDRLLRLDQISNDVDRWPHGNVWYLYGSYFVQHIARAHGAASIARMIDDYANDVIPYGLNRIARRATGKTFTTLYADFLAATRVRYAAQADAIRAAGLVEGTRITHHGEEAKTPRFLPDGRVIYFAGDNRSLAALRTLDARTGADLETRADVAGVAAAAPHPDGRHVLFSALDAHRDLYAFNDLFALDLRTGERERLTHGARAQEPDVSPNGRRVAYTINSAGTTHLAIAELADVPGTQRVLVRSRRFEQVYAPRFSPDGRTIAYSCWSAGGYRDLRLVDVASGAVTAVMRDRAYDAGPAWSPDGEHLYFSSDRTGVANIYAWERATGAMRQVTNVIAGAFQPTISPDGQRLVYVGYTSYGFDLFSMTLDPARFRDAPPFVDTRPAPSETEQIDASVERRDYSPWGTLRPYAYGLDLTPDAFGQQLGVSTTGGDVVGRHTWAARVGVGLARGDVTLDAAYGYRGLPVALSGRVFRLVSPQGGLQVGGEDRTWIADDVGVDVGASYTFRRALASDSIAAGYTLRWLGQAEPFGGALDPNDPGPLLPERGRLAQLRLGWSYATVRRFVYDISPSEGAFLAANVAAAHPLLGSQFRSVSLSYVMQGYFRNPVWRLHVLALRYAGGVSEGDLGRRGVFSVGGFPTVSIVDALTQFILVGGAALRGYPTGVRFGTQYHLAQAEYRFPLFRPQVGPATLPVYVNRLYAGVFLDVGDAFNGRLDLATFLVGTGAELYADVTLGYFLPFTLRFGVARGLSDGGVTQTYVNLGTPF